jgi:hypothetical protein
VNTGNPFTQNRRTNDVKLSDVPGALILQFEQGYVPMDEPPGLEEHAYRAWKEAGGAVKAKPAAESEPAVWAVISLMGHKTLAGRLTEEEKFGVKLGRVDVPTGDGFRTEYFGGGSIYGIQIVSEQVARDVCKRTVPAPVSPWDYPKAIQSQQAPIPMTLSDDWEGNNPDD